jgi:hypothetical protein
MPFGVKPVDPPVDKTPAKIDFDALWNRIYRPVIEELGYEPVRFHTMSVTRQRIAPPGASRLG